MENTKIPWAHDTLNFWYGCAPVSEGCQNCYARELMERRYKKCEFREGAPRVRTLNAFNDLRRFAGKPWVCSACGKAMKAPLPGPAGGGLSLCVHCGAKPVARRRVFVESLGDFFDASVPMAWRYNALRQMLAEPRLVFMLLTKRPENVPGQLHRLSRAANGSERFEECEPAAEFGLTLERWMDGEPPGNIWLGVTGENGANLLARWERLRGLPARQYFLSLEPLLADVADALETVLLEAEWARDPVWVIVGGESGENARWCATWHIENVVRVCRRRGVRVFVKQLGRRVATTDVAEGWPAFAIRPVSPPSEGVVEVMLRDAKGGDPREWPERLRIQQTPTGEECAC